MPFRAAVLPHSVAPLLRLHAPWCLLRLNQGLRRLTGLRRQVVSVKSSSYSSLRLGVQSGVRVGTVK